MARDYRLCPVAASRELLPRRPSNPLRSPFGCANFSILCVIISNVEHLYWSPPGNCQPAFPSLSVGNGFTEVPIDLMARRLHNVGRCEKLTKQVPFGYGSRLWIASLSDSGHLPIAGAHAWPF